MKITRVRTIETKIIFTGEEVVDLVFKALPKRFFGVEFEWVREVNGDYILTRTETK